MKDEGETPFLHSSSFILDPSSLIAAALRPLPIEALRLPAETVELLHSLGIWRIGQLEPLPREELAARFGPRLAQRWDQATGKLAEPLPAYGPPPRFLRRLVVGVSGGPPRADRGGLGAADRPAVGDVGPLRPGGPAVAMPAVVFRGGGRRWRSPSACSRPPPGRERLFPLVQLQLERLRLPGPVRAMSVEATLTAPLECRQQELFPDDTLALATAASGRAGRAAQQPAGGEGRGAGAAAAGGPAGTGLPLRAAGCKERGQSPAQRGRPADAGGRSCRRGLCGCWPGRGGWRSRQSCPMARCGLSRFSAGRAPRRSRSPAAGGRSGSRPAGGAGRPSAAIITGWKPRPAAACGSFAASATAAGSCTECLIERSMEGVRVRVRS